MDENYKQDFIKAGSLAKEVRSFGKSLIKKGASYNDILTQVNRKILDLGARPAFPPQIALNNVAAHFLPFPEEDIILADDVVKLDVGICYNGAIGDCAVTVDLSGKYQKLVDAVEAALLAAEKSVEIGKPVSEIGRVIEKTIQSFGLKPVKNLSGHGLGYYKIHTPPQIPNYSCETTAIIKPGMTFAIEPFATDGKGLIYESGTPTIFSYLRSRPLFSPVNRLLIAKIKSFTGLPFSLHNLIGEDLSYDEVKTGVAELIKAKVIQGYPPLLEEAKGFVAQAENSILVDKSGKVIVTTR